MKKKVFGCDIGSKFIILHDGKNYFKIYSPHDLLSLSIIDHNSIVVLEQTGAYGLRWAEIFFSLGADVYIVDGKDFKNFRLSKSRKKDDKIDALYLRKYFFSKRHKCKPFNRTQIHIRALIRQHIRNEKDLTKHINRLKQYLAYIFPFDDYFNLSRSKFLKKLNEIEQKLKNSPHTLNELALSELQKLKISLHENKRLEQEIITIAKNHPDYEILKTFPMGDIQIATLIAYSYNIDDFKHKDGYIAYVLMGSNIEQSGISVYKVKTDRARTEVKGLFYPLFMLSHRKTKNWKHPLNPLANFVRELVNTSYNYKKRYIKFLSRFLELTYFARKYRLTYTEALKQKLERIEQEEQKLKEKILKNQITNSLIYYKLQRLTSKKRALQEMIELSQQRQDIPSPQTQKAQEAKGEGQQVYLLGEQKQKQEEKENEREKKEKKKRAIHDREKGNNKGNTKGARDKRDRTIEGRDPRDDRDPI